METYTLPFAPPNLSPLHIAYFEDVENSSSIKRRLVSAATTPGPDGELARAAVDFAFIDADLLMYKVGEMNQLKMPAAELEAAKCAAIVNAVAVKHAM
ncbi:hypothetical protein CspHIS471_0603030 [Cutaneotrichosporon sp. HIS471]|nr:hypothetical protein CspHIS471_0603030 [Cutaneotrichosporon sp. HIS471]